MTGRHAWTALAAAIAAYEILAQDGELLSEEVDRWIDAHPHLTRATIAIIALHLANLLPPAIDPIHQATRIRRHRKAHQ